MITSLDALDLNQTYSYANYSYANYLTWQFGQWVELLKGKGNKEIYTVIQPNICVICDPPKLDDRGCLGEPDFIIEIGSVGNS